MTAETGRDCWVIGSEIDESRITSEEYQDRFLASMWKRWDQVVLEAVSKYLEGKLSPGRHELGLETGAVDYATEGGNLSPANLERLEEIRAEILTGAVVPPTTSAEPPRWTREPEATATLVFDGQTCSADTRVLEVAAGDVVRVDIVNESDEVVEVKIGWAVDDDPSGLWISGNPWEADAVYSSYLSTRTAPGATNALSGRLYPGTLVADCFADGTALPGIVITARFEMTCQGPPVDSDDPVDVIRALEDAFNARNPDAVCSLFSDDATAELDFGREPELFEGNETVAKELTFQDDDLWMEQMVFLNIEASGSVVSWVSEWNTYTGTLHWCDTAEVHDGKIITFKGEPCPPGE